MTNGAERDDEFEGATQREVERAVEKAERRDYSGNKVDSESSEASDSKVADAVRSEDVSSRSGNIPDTFDLHEPWNPSVSTVDNIRPFLDVADERGYTIGENAEDMAVARYDGDRVILESVGRTEASYNIVADLMSEETEFGVRVPSACYDGSASLDVARNQSAGVLITEELGEGVASADTAPSMYAESLVNTLAFEALMGQGDILDNVSADGNGLFAYDFANAGENIRGVYNALKGEMLDIARNNSFESEIDSCDVLGERAVEMAESIDLDSLEYMAESRNVDQEVYESVEENIEIARGFRDTEESIQNYFEPNPGDDAGVELL